MMKENQRIALTRRLLREALLSLLEEMPLEKISVSLLCRTAGINRTTFYHHYQTPNDLLADMENELIREIQHPIPLPLSRETALRILTEICTRLQANANILRVLFRCKVDNQLAKVITDTNQRLSELRDSLPDKQNWDQDALRLTAVFLGTGGYFLIRQWILEGIDKSPEEIASLVLGIISK